VSYINERLLAASSNELAVLIRSLWDHRAKVIEPLWAKLVDKSTPRDTRLRAACALAAYDSGSQRWDTAQDDVSAMLVAVNPADLGQWKEALRPVHAALLDPLTTIFRDASRSQLELSLATALLADYAAGDAGRLATLISEADAEQFAVLFPLLSKHGKEAINRLQSMVDRVPKPDWNDPPLNPSWPTVDAADSRAIETAQGLIRERFAFCQTMPLEQFQSVAANLTKSGYRPLRFRPFTASGAVLVAAVWTRDGSDWRIETGTTPDGIRKKAVELRSAGYIPMDVSGYAIAGGHDPAGQLTLRYSALWIKAGNDDFEAQAYVGVTLDKDREYTETQQQKGFSRTAYVTLQDGDGEDRYCAVWTKRTSETTGFESKSLDGLSPEEQRQRAEPWIADGYRPAAISVAETKEHQTLTSDLVWHQPLVGTLHSVKIGKDRAGAAIAMLRMGVRDEILETLRVRDDPEVLTQFIHRCRERGVTAAELVECLRRADQLRQNKSGDDRKIEDRVIFGVLVTVLLSIRLSRLVRHCAPEVTCRADDARISRQSPVPPQFPRTLSQVRG
jgi:hypothetical protein